MSRHRFVKALASEAEEYMHEEEDDEYNEDRFDEEYEGPSQKEIDAVFRGIGEIAQFITEGEVIDALTGYSVDEAVDWIICHVEDYQANYQARMTATAAASHKSPSSNANASKKPGKKTPTATAPTKTQSPSVSATPTAAAAKTTANSGTNSSGSSKKKEPGSATASSSNNKKGGLDTSVEWDDLDALNMTRNASDATDDSTHSDFLMPEDHHDEHQGKDRINLVFVGHVDAGKSTLNGNLLYLAGHVSQQKMHKYNKESKAIGKGSFALAWVMDGNKEERERGVTMDVGITHFYTDTKRVVFLDAPGHRDFVPNMISGAAQADAAVLVVDATPGEFEAGFSAGGQTREHTLLVRSLGISQVIVAVNKMDMANWEQCRYNEIVEQLSQYLKQAGYSDSNVAYIPCSGFSGENLLEAAEPRLLSWYKGKSMLTAIDALKPPVRIKDLPLRLCVCDVFKTTRMGLTAAGKIESGTISVGEKVLIMPGSIIATVKGIESEHMSKKVVEAGENVSVGLAGIEPSMIGIGFVLCAIDHPVPLVRRCRAQIITFDNELPLIPGQHCVVYTQSANESAMITKLIGLIDRSTGEAGKKRPKCISKNSAAVIEITFERPACLELFSSCKSLGRVTLRDAGKTLAAGTVVRIVEVEQPPAPTKS